MWLIHLPVFNKLISLGCFAMVKSAEKRSTWEEGGENAGG